MNQNKNEWDLIDDSKREMEKISSKNLTYAKDVWRRFTKNKYALTGLFVIFILLVLAIIGPNLSSKSYDKQNLDHVSIPPSFDTYVIEGHYYYVSPNLKVIEVSEKGEILSLVPKIKEDGMKKRIEFALGTQTYYLNYKTNGKTYTKPTLENTAGEPVQQMKKMFNKTYVLGTDGLGRDLWIRLIYGARISLTVAFIAAFVNLLIGTLYGSVSAYIGGNVDLVMMRIVDIISTIPLMLYVILIMVLLNNSGLQSIIIALGLVYWVNMARVVRAQILSLKELDYIYASKTMGSSTWYIITKHLIPNAMGPIIVTATMLIPSAIFTEAFMSFIGLGVAVPMASWGTMCNVALETLRIFPYQLFFPALAICIAMFAFNFVGDGLRDALDPKMRK